MAPAVSQITREKAERIAAAAHLFHKGRSKRNGQGFTFVPSTTTPGAVYYSNHLGCTCDGFRNRGVCCHQQAMLLVVQRESAAIRAASLAAKPHGPCQKCPAAAVGKSRRCGRHLVELAEKLGI